MKSLHALLVTVQNVQKNNESFEMSIVPLEISSCITYIHLVYPCDVILVGAGGEERRGEG